MEIRKGIAVAPGYAIGDILLLDIEEYRIPEKLISEQEIAKETKRFENARKDAIEELNTYLTKFSKKAGEVAKRIVEAHLLMLEDNVLKNEIYDAIKKSRFSAEYAVSKTVRKKAKTISDWGNTDFAEKVKDDLLEIEKILIRNLLGSKREDVSHLTKKVVIAAKDLSPAQTMALDKDKILGILTDRGGRTSHSAIIASSLGIPAIVGLESITADLSSGDTVILDGTTGTVIINPDDDTIKRYTAMERNFYLLEKRLVKEQRNLPATTKDGHKVTIYANIETPDEIQAALDYGAEGIGLYRTEFIYLSKNLQPAEKDHLNAYTDAVSTLGGKKLVIRTLDMGADKMPLDGLPQESNPFLGTRAIRLCFQKLDIFRTQLRSILKVSALGNVSIMFPMISSLNEILQIKDIIQEVKGELKAEGERYNEKIDIGIMIEVPSAALIADLLVKEVDFFSIGTNDLIAYSIAVDRLNEKVASLYQPAHPAIIRLLKHVIEIGAKHHKTVSVCGEMSSDVTYTVLLLGMGLRTFSAVPPAIPEIKKVIRSISLSDAKEIAEKSFSFDNANDTITFLRDETRKIVPDVIQ